MNFCSSNIFIKLFYRGGKESTCAPSYKGKLCSICEPEFNGDQYARGAGLSCSKCQPPAIQGLMIIGMVAAISIYIIYIL